MNTNFLTKVLDEIKNQKIPFNVLARRIKIALDDGHGMGTAGKRSPMFPNGITSPDTGKNFMHENEFNRRVVALAKVHLERCGFEVILTAPTDADTPLKDRVALANRLGADLFVSVHANAFLGVWGVANGIETFTYGSGESLRVGKILHQEVMKGTQMTDRGVKNGAHLYVIKYTKMPAILLELGFMDNLSDAKHLLTEKYRQESALEVAVGICRAYNVKFVPEKPAYPIDAPKTTSIGNLTVLVPVLNVRYSYDVKSPVVKTITKGKSFKVFDKRNGMYRVGINQWVSTRDDLVKFEALKPVPVIKPTVPKTLYRVQVGAFGVKPNADRLKKELEDKGFTALVVFETPHYKVQVGAFGVKENADAQVEKLKKAGYKPFVTS